MSETIWHTYKERLGCAHDLSEIAVLFDPDRNPHITVHEREPETGETPLTLACQHSGLGGVETVRFLLNLGAEVNTPGRGGNTPLHHAVCRENSPSLVSILLNAGADINVRNEDSINPLYGLSGELAVGAAQFLNGVTPLFSGLEHSYKLSCRSPVGKEVVESNIITLGGRGADFFAPGPNGVSAVDLIFNPELHSDWTQTARRIREVMRKFVDIEPPVGAELMEYARALSDRRVLSQEMEGVTPQRVGMSKRF